MDINWRPNKKLRYEYHANNNIPTMIWKTASPGIRVAHYVGWQVTEIEKHIDRYNKQHYLYIAINTATGEKHEGCSWEFIKTRILSTHQIPLF